MTDSRPMPSVAGLPDYLRILTEAEGFILDFDSLHELVASDPGIFLIWVDAAGRVLTVDYQQRLLAAATAVMRREVPKPGNDRELLTILANNLADLLNKRQAIDDEMDQARADFDHACASLSQLGALVRDAAHWNEDNLVCDLDVHVHTVWTPAGTTGPWQRVRVDASTLQSLAQRCTDRPGAGAPPQIRLRDDAFDLIIAHPDGHLTTRPLPRNPDGRYLLTGISWSRPADPANPAPDTDPPLDAPPTRAAPDGSRTAESGPPIAPAEINTGHFTFHAFGATPQQARDNLIAA